MGNSIDVKSVIRIYPDLDFCDFLAKQLGNEFEIDKSTYGDNRHVEFWMRYEEQPLFAKFRRRSDRAEKVIIVRQFGSDVSVQILSPLFTNQVKQAAQEYLEDFESKKQTKGTGFDTVVSELNLKVVYSKVSGPRKTHN